MGWKIRDLLWTDRIGCNEYVFGLAGPEVTWDDTLSTGALTNEKRTAAGGQNVVKDVWIPPPDDDTSFGNPWIVELTIDVCTGDLRVGVVAGAYQFNYEDYTSTCYWSPDGSYCINYGQASGFGGEPAWVFGTGDRLGIAITGRDAQYVPQPGDPYEVRNSQVWFFKNGELLGHGGIQYYAAGPTYRIWMRGGSGQATLNGDLDSMLFASQYRTALPSVAGWSVETPATALIVTLESDFAFVNQTIGPVTVRANGAITGTLHVTMASSIYGDMFTPLSPLILSRSSPVATFEVSVDPDATTLGTRNVLFDNDGELMNGPGLAIGFYALPTPTPLMSGETVSVSGEIESTQYFSIDVPAGQSNLEIRAVSGSGDADLYVSRDTFPTRQTHDDASELPGKTNETIAVDFPDAGTWYVLVYGHGAFQDASLTLTVTA